MCCGNQELHGRTRVIGCLYLMLLNEVFLENWNLEWPVCHSRSFYFYFFFFFSLPDAHSEGTVLNAIQCNIPDLTCRQL